MNTGAITAWNAGATGAGISVAVVDSGIDAAQPDLQGRISPLSTDIVAGRGLPQGEDNHGTFVSGVVAAGFNGFGTIGVAYESTIISIRADVNECNDPDNTVCFRSTDLANALDYATANGARVINLSLGGEGPLGAAFEAALQRAITAGVVFAIAAGNEFDDDPDFAVNPSWPGRYASDPRFAGAIIVVGAHDSANTIAVFSNRAGVSSNKYLSAPGVAIVSQCDGTRCFVGSGTSFASPAVAGALALLLDAFPNLTGRQAVEILLRSARDAGATGEDGIYGRGLLDIAQAFQPSGAANVAMASSGAIQVTAQRFSYTGRAFGDALQRAGALQTVGRDDFDRLFRVNLGAAYGLAPRADRAYAPQVERRQAQLTVDAPMGGALALTSSASIDMSGADPAAATHAVTPWLDDRERRDVMLEYSMGDALVALWQGRNGARSPFEMGAGDGFASLAQVDRAWMGAVRLGGMTLTADAGTGDRLMPFKQAEEDVSQYARFSAAWRPDAASELRVAVGALDEKMGPLGSYAPIGSGFDMPSQSTFAGVSGRFDLGRGLMLDAEVSFARTDIVGRFLSLTDPALSSSWSLGLTSFCSQLGFGCQALTLSISQPLRVERGTFSAYLPDVPLEYFDPLTFSERRFSATPTGRQVDVALGTQHRLSDQSWLNLRAVVSREDQHIREAPTALTVTGAWRTAF